MGGSKRITIAPGVTRNNYEWGFILRGRKDALLAARVPASWLSVEIDRDLNGHVIRTPATEYAGLKVRVTQYAKNKFSVHVETPDEEKSISDDRRQAVLQIIDPRRSPRAGAAAQADADYQRFMGRVTQGIDLSSDGEPQA